MAVNMFLKLDGITGESTNKGHKDEIEILSFSWGVAHPAPVTHGAHGRAARATERRQLHGALERRVAALFLASHRPAPEAGHLRDRDGR